MILPAGTVELLDRCTFPPPRAALACAVSGGSDSLALLVLAVAAGCEVTAYHIDHGLRPGSDAEAEVVREVAGQLGAGFEAHRVECAPGPNLEARARTARRAVLPENAATGHTMDDQAETVLINLLRGAGLDGLSGMRPGWQHPILSLRRVETAELVASLGVAPVVDPTNTDARFLRNRVRHELLPMLRALSGRDVVPVLARQAGLLREESALLEKLATALDARDVGAMRDAPLALQRRALRRFVRVAQDSQYPPDADAIERLVAVVSGARVATEVPGGGRVARSHGRLSYTAPDRQA